MKVTSPGYHDISIWNRREYNKKVEVYNILY